MENTYREFVSQLKKLYGEYDETHKKFEKAPNSEIARELGYSDAQFSRLINESATEGEYARANQNARRILTLLHLERQVKVLSVKKSPARRFVSGVIIAAIALALGYLLGGKMSDPVVKEAPRYDMLRWSFETEFINSYTKLKDLPQDCNFPCYKYQGKWELKNAYKLPFFRERSGFHYLATEAHMYARCMPEKSASGTVIEGYEYQNHEIWYDKRELPIDSFVTQNGLDLISSYRGLDFRNDDNFVKVAYVHTFFRNEFNLDSAQVIRNGKVIGRDVEFVPEAELRDELGNNGLVKAVLNEVSQIIANRLEDFSRPVNCVPASVPRPNFHEINEGSEMHFDCRLTTGRVSIPYRKTYVLVDQYVKNRCRPD